MLSKPRLFLNHFELEFMTWIKGLRLIVTPVHKHFFAHKLEFMTWIKGLRPAPLLVQNTIVDVKLEFMTWIKGLRLTSQSLNIFDVITIRIYDLNKGITTRFFFILNLNFRPQIRIYDLNKGITTAAFCS